MARELFFQSQQAKERVVLKGETIIFSLNQAAFAFGVSNQAFLQMVRRGKSLLIEPMGESVKASLIPSAKISQRDLWKEMIFSFERSRSEAYKNRNDYVNLYAQIQRGLSTDWEDDTGLLHMALYVLWEQIPPGMQRSLCSMSPGQVRSSIGVVGSTD